VKRRGRTTPTRDVGTQGSELLADPTGGGFGVLGDKTVLRQFVARVPAPDASVFRPAPRFDLPTPGEQGTPLPKDEPQAENPPAGAIIDYYLKAAPAGVVTLEILDGAGAVVRRFASDDRPQPRDPNSLSVQTIWPPPLEPLPATAGMHRWVWDLRPTPQGGGRGRGAGGGGGFGRGGAAVPHGTYTVRLTVDGKTYTQPLAVRADPRGTF